MLHAELHQARELMGRAQAVELRDRVLRPCAQLWARVRRRGCLVQIGACHGIGLEPRIEETELELGSRQIRVVHEQPLEGAHACFVVADLGAEARVAQRELDVGGILEDLLVEAQEFRALGVGILGRSGKCRCGEAQGETDPECGEPGLRAPTRARLMLLAFNQLGSPPGSSRKSLRESRVLREIKTVAGPM